MFEIRLSYREVNLDIVSLKCINFKSETGLDSETSFYWVFDEVVNTFVLSAILHHVGMSGIISSNK